MDEVHSVSHGRYGNGATDSEVGLKTLLGRLNQDATQLIHDELDLAKLELRDIANTLSAEISEAGSTLAKDATKAGIALGMALLAGFALTAFLIIAIGDMLDAYWAGALIVGVLLLIGTALLGSSAAKDMKTNEALRLERTRRTLQKDRQVVVEEVRETKQFAAREAREFKEHASPGHTH